MGISARANMAGNARKGPHVPPKAKLALSAKNLSRHRSMESSSLRETDTFATIGETTATGRRRDLNHTNLQILTGRRQSLKTPQAAGFAVPEHRICNFNRRASLERTPTPRAAIVWNRAPVPNNSGLRPPAKCAFIWRSDALGTPRLFRSPKRSPLRCDSAAAKTLARNVRPRGARPSVRNRPQPYLPLVGGGRRRLAVRRSADRRDPPRASRLGAPNRIAGRFLASPAFR